MKVMKEDLRYKVTHIMVIYKKTQSHKDVDCLQTEQIQNNSIKKNV